MLILLVFVTIRAFPYLNQCLLHIYYNITSKNKASCLTPCFFLKGFLILWFFFNSFFNWIWQGLRVLFHWITSISYVIIVKLDAFSTRCVFIILCPDSPFFWGEGGVYLHITSCPCGEGILFLSCPSVRLSFWQSITKVTLPTSWNRIPLNYVCLLITVWRITYHYSLQIGQFS